MQDRRKLNILKNVVADCFNKIVSFIDVNRFDDEYLQADLQKRIRQIKSRNRERLLKELIIPYFRDVELLQSGLLLSDKNLRPRAEASLRQAMRDGKVDEFFNIVRG